VCVWGVWECHLPLPLLGQGWSLDEVVAPPPEGMSLDTPPAETATPQSFGHHSQWALSSLCCGMTGRGRWWDWGYLVGLGELNDR